MVSVAAVVVGGANMADLQQAFERHLVRSRFFATQDKVVVAVSTGVDSMVLLDLLQHLPLKYRPQIIVAHMNHELRKQSQLEERFIRQYCKQNDLKLAVAHNADEDGSWWSVESISGNTRSATICFWNLNSAAFTL